MVYTSDAATASRYGRKYCFKNSIILSERSSNHCCRANLPSYSQVFVTLPLVCSHKYNILYLYDILDQWRPTTSYYTVILSCHNLVNSCFLLQTQREQQQRTTQVRDESHPGPDTVLFFQSSFSS